MCSSDLRERGRKREDERERMKERGRKRETERERGREREKREMDRDRDVLRECVRVSERTITDEDLKRERKKVEKRGRNIPFQNKINSISFTVKFN